MGNVPLSEALHHSKTIIIIIISHIVMTDNKKLYMGVGISLPKDMVRQLDEERKDVGRSRYIMRMLEKNLVGSTIVKENKENKEEETEA